MQRCLWCLCVWAGDECGGVLCCRFVWAGDESGGVCSGVGVYGLGMSAKVSECVGSVYGLGISAGVSCVVGLYGLGMRCLSVVSVCMGWG